MNLPKDIEQTKQLIQVGIPKKTETIAANTPIYPVSNVVRVYNAGVDTIKMYHYDTTKDVSDQGVSIPSGMIENFGVFSSCKLEFTGEVQLTWYY